MLSNIVTFCIGIGVKKPLQAFILTGENLKYENRKN
jgi:hypothetical protein